MNVAVAKESKSSQSLSGFAVKSAGIRSARHASIFVLSVVNTYALIVRKHAKRALVACVESANVSAGE